MVKEATRSKQPKSLENLNPEQKEAVLYKEGPLLIVAGAGTGKTNVITKRIAYLIEKKLVKPEEILALTFTEKAAEEMEERVDRLLPFGYFDLWISTFHSFGQRILEEHGLDIGLSSDFKLLDQTSAWLLVRQNLDKFNLDYYKPLGNPTKFIHALLTHFSRCKDEGIYPEDYLNYAEDLKQNFDDGIFVSKAGDKKETIDQKKAEIEQMRVQEIANAYHIYQRLLLANNELDFGDLINYCLRLFQQRPMILEKYRKQFKYVLVDEFQDTNWAQYQLIKILSAPKNNLTVCLDDDQSLYRWRGASINNVLQFQNDYSQAKQIVLVKNYRSSQNILDLAYNFIQFNNPNRLEYQLNQDKNINEQAKEKGINIQSFKKVDKKLKAQTTEKGIIENLHFKSLGEEAGGVVEKIAETLQKDSEASFLDFAILVRANNSANVFCKALEKARIPYEFLASKGLYSQAVILDIIAYFKMLDNYHESSALNRLLTLPFLNIDWEEIAKINYYSQKKALSTYETLNEISLVPKIKPESVKKANFLLDIIKKHSKLAKEKSISEVFLLFLEDSQYLKHIVKGNNERNIEFITQFYKKIKKFEESQPEVSLSAFIQQINMETESGESGALDFDVEKGLDAVRVMTIHGAKGLEFKYVFIPNLVDKRFPTITKSDPIKIPSELIKEILPEGDIHLQEERRLFYVAMTRAKRGLFLSWADDYGGIRKKKPSRFLSELNIKPSLNIENKENLSLKPSKAQKIKPRNNFEQRLPPYFSFSQFAAFKKCPLQYKFAHILKIPRKGRASLSFGKTIHNTLFKFTKIFVERQNKEQEVLFGSINSPVVNREQLSNYEKNNFKLDSKNEIKQILEIYKKEWIDEWYEDKNQKKEYYELGKKILKNFLKSFLKELPQIKFLDGQPLLEKDFYLKLGDCSIRGKIDRIDDLSDGEIEIIDYKTGESKDKLKKEDKEQLLIYQLAGEQILGKIPKRLSYYYLTDNKKISFESTEKEREDLKTKVIENVEKIRKSDFKATPGWDCKFCDFKDICEFRKL